MSVINTNVNSLIANAAIQRNNRDLSLSMQQLSTGKRINSASDDAAGLAISSRMTATIRGLDQAVRNANDGISMIQTAEGAMVEITNMLQRMRELSVQSSNDTNTLEDRQYLNLEFQQLKQEIDRIAKNTEWNGMPVLSNAEPNNGFFEFQVGAKSGQKISLTIPDLTFNPIVTTTSVVANAKQMEEQQLILYGGYWDGVQIKFSDALNINSEIINIGNGDFSGYYDVTSHDAGGLIAHVVYQNNSWLAQNYNIYNSGNVIHVNPSTSNADALALKYEIYRNGQLVDIENTIWWKDGTLTPNITAADFENLGELETAITTTTEGGMHLLNASNILDKEAADASIDTVDQALTRINLGRASLGAVINRLTYAADNLTNVSTNTTASRSRILDADYAKATTVLAKSQIIAQAATSMLAQANQNPQTVLQLLQR